jgi:HSP20 family protein
MRLAKWEPFKTVARWDPARDFEEMTERLNRFIDRGPAEEPLATAAWSPIVDIQETDKEYLIKAELPEVKKEDVKVTVKDGVLTLEGERHQEKEEKNKKFHRMERSYGQFMRCFTMPEDAEPQSVRAEFKDGILSVHLVKSAAPKPKGVEVTVN